MIDNYTKEELWEALRMAITLTNCGEGVHPSYYAMPTTDTQELSAIITLRKIENEHF